MSLKVLRITVLILYSVLIHLQESKKKFIINYIQEIARVLKDNGKAIIHFPNSDIESCIERDFTKISTKEIEDEVKKNILTTTI